jgi:hypothetical protein
MYLMSRSKCNLLLATQEQVLRELAEIKKALAVTPKPLQS